MGYYTHITGGFIIEPPIDEKHWPADFCDDGEGCYILKQVDGDEDVQIVNGKLTVVGTSAGHTEADWRWEESGKFYDHETDLNALIGFAQSHGSKVNGVINGDGEENGDIWRIRVVDNKRFDERPELLWPNGDRVSL